VVNAFVVPLPNIAISNILQIAMKLGEKLIRLRTLEGFARGLGRELTQAEVARAIRAEHGGQFSQSYLSQLESGSRTHMTGNTRLLLAKFFRVHPGHLVDDLDDMPHARVQPRRDLDDKLDVWLIEGSEDFAEDRRLSEALLRIAKHPHSRECLILLGSIVENGQLIDHLVESMSPPPEPSRRKRKA
jgi:transcriptional regulator with XRE-family HTH domain